MAKKVFNTEADIRNFKSKVLLYPRKLLLQMQQMVDDGKREWAIENFLKQNYKGSLGIATPPTISTWIDWYEAKKKLAIATGSMIEPTRTDVAIVEKMEVAEMVKQHRAVLDGATDISNKKALLETLIRKCIERLKHVESIQEMEGTTAALEAVVGHYLREMHSIIQTQLKLSGELREEDDAFITKAVNENAYKLVQIFFSSINEIAPEKADLLKDSILKKLNDFQVTSEVVSR